MEISSARLAAADAQLAQQRAGARERIAEMARARFEGGTVSVMTVLEAERDWADAKVTVRQLEAAQQTEALALEKALGAI